MNRYIVFLFILLSLFSCKKKEQHKQNTCDTAPSNCSHVEIANAMYGFFFLPNSYWIYKNDSLNIYDSVVLQSVQTGCEVQPWYLSYCYTVDYFIMNYRSFLSGNLYYDCIEGSILMRNFHPWDAHWYYGWMLFNSEGGPIIDSLRVGNLTFYNLEISKDSTYCAKNIGIVKRGIGTGKFYLVRWKIYR